jgi:hypothetical protein
MSGRKYVRLNNILLKRSDTIVACVLLSRLAPDIPEILKELRMLPPRLKHKITKFIGLLR